MSLRSELKRNWRSAVVGGALSAALGLLLAHSHVSESLSYDLPYLFRPDVPVDEALIIGIDEDSLLRLKQEPGARFSRSRHADLLARLRQARLVVFDVILADVGLPEENQKLVQAIASNGKVLLAARFEQPSRENPDGIVLEKLFRTNALDWGLAEIDSGIGDISRLHDAGNYVYPSLPWVAAARAEARVTLAPSPVEKEAARIAERWINYYGPNAIPTVSYAEALEQPAGYFSNKFVFVGELRVTPYPGAQADIASTPFKWWTGERAGGVEIIATTFLNLYRGDWLTRLSNWIQMPVLLLAGFFFGSGLRLVRPLPGAVLALVSMGIIAILAVLWVWSQGVWFCWGVLAGVQIPFAYLYALIAQATVLSERIREQETRLRQIAPPAPAPDQTRRIAIPNHTLLKNIGEGSYGQVWLARNAVGLHFAVKIVLRDKFNSEAPYEREFRGIQKYMPVSMSHPGLLQILHVGRDDAQGYFFYIMELGDDEITGQLIDPDRYAPRSLASELKRRGPLPAEGCVSLMLHLTRALDHLHRQGRIHRDIKPANIVYVRGIPKFADIGLVTAIAPGGAAPTFLGTKGYLAPEGPGTVTADLYSLGVVLYVAWTGLTPDQFPELPTQALNSPSPLQQALVKIIYKACELNLPRRYPSAAEMHADLVRLQTSLGVPDQPTAAE